MLIWSIWRNTLRSRGRYGACREMHNTGGDVTLSFGCFYRCSNPQLLQPRAGRDDPPQPSYLRSLLGQQMASVPPGQFESQFAYQNEAVESRLQAEPRVRTPVPAPELSPAMQTQDDSWEKMYTVLASVTQRIAGFECVSLSNLCLFQRSTATIPTH